MERIIEEEQDITMINNETSSDTRERIGLRRLEIVLDNTQHVYYSGRLISGKIFLDLQTPIEGLDGKSQNEIEAGVYPFSIKLPENSACSFEGRYGRVRYSMRAILDVTNNSRFSTEHLAFTVAPIFDLNKDQLATLPMSERLSKTFMGQTEPLSMSAFIPVRGYVPGQTIPLKITLKNTSNVDVKKLRIVFKKVVLYRSSEKVRKHKEIIVEIEQPVDRKSEDYETDVDVPAVPPSGTICNLIDVRYTLKVEACVDVNEWYYRMFHKNLKIRTPVIVGTVPLLNYEDPLESSDDSQSDTIAKKSQIDRTTIVNKADESNTMNIDNETTIKSSTEPALKYQRSRIYRSSKPDRDDPTGDEGDSDGEVKPYSPMYRVYKFGESR